MCKWDWQAEVFVLLIDNIQIKTKLTNSSQVVFFERILFQFAVSTGLVACQDLGDKHLHHLG